VEITKERSEALLMPSGSSTPTQVESASGAESTDGGIATHQDKRGAEVRILQIIPCGTPVFALFDDYDELPVVCWALIERRPDSSDTGDNPNFEMTQEVRGMIPSRAADKLEFADRDGFKGYNTHR
jgi:hypothetical protein